MKYFLFLILIPFISSGQHSRDYYHIPDSLKGCHVVLWDEFELSELVDNTLDEVHPKLRIVKGDSGWIIKERDGRTLRMNISIYDRGGYYSVFHRYVLNSKDAVAYFPDRKRAQEILALRKRWIILRTTLDK